MATTRDWLLDDSPSSRLQARLGRSYRLTQPATGKEGPLFADKKSMA